MSNKTYAIGDLAIGLTNIADKIEWSKSISMGSDTRFDGTHNGIYISVQHVQERINQDLVFIYKIYLNGESVFEGINSAVESLWWKIIDIDDAKSKIKFDDMCNKLFNDTF